MKKVIRLFTVFLLIFNLCWSGATFATDLTHIHEDLIRIGGDDNYPPYEFVDESGNFRGFNVDIIRAIAIELGIEIEFVPSSWEDAMLNLENDETDAVQGMTVTEDRNMLFDFTEHTIINSQAIFVLSDTGFINDLSDLKGRKVSVQSQDVTSEIFRKMNIENIDIIEKVNQFEAIESLLEGEVDAFVGNQLTGIYYVQKLNLTDSIKIVGEPIYTTDYSIAVNDGNYELLELLDTGLETIKDNGTYDKIYEKWFGKTIPDVNAVWRNLLYISFTGLIIALIVISLIYYWNSNLKKQVLLRTKEIQLSNAFRGKVIDSIIHGIVVFDKDFYVTQSNKIAGELLEKDIFIYKHFKELVGDKIPNIAMEMALNGDTWKDSLQWEQKNGDIKHIECGLIPIKESDHIEGYFLLINDRTTIFELFNMAKHNDKMKALGELSAGMAHELRNPLTAIKTFIDLIPYKINDENFRDELLSIVPKEINRMDDLIVSLLDYAKPRNPLPETILLEDILNEVLTLIKQKIKSKKLEIFTSGTDNYFYADRSQMVQIMLNILLNSVESFYIKGVIKIEGQLVEDKLLIHIKDDGHGIPEEKLDKLFEPFYTSKKSGYGIGLSITERLIKENKGSIVIKSTENVGTKVTIALPTKPLNDKENNNV